MYVPLVAAMGFWLSSVFLTRNSSRKSYLISFVATCALGSIGWLIYLNVGAAPDMDVKRSISKAFETGTKEDVQRALEDVEKRMQKQVDNPQYLALAGMLEAQLGRTQEAEQYYQQLVSVAPESSEAHAEYAQQRYIANDRKIDQQVVRSVQRALTLDDTNVTGLGLKGIIAFQMAAFEDAAKAWGRGMQLSTPDSPAYNFLAQGAYRAMQSAQEAKNSNSEMAARAAKAFARLMSQPEVLGSQTLEDFLPAESKGAKTAALASSTTKEGVTQENTDGFSLKLRLTWEEPPSPGRIGQSIESRLAALQKAYPAGVLLVYTRRIEGPRMPLAIKRLKLNEVPGEFVLDARSRMMPAMDINSSSEQELIIRFAPDGKIAADSSERDALAKILVAKKMSFLKSSNLIEEVRLSIPEPQ